MYTVKHGQTNRRSLHESQQHVCPVSAAAAAAAVTDDVSVSEAEDRLTGDDGGPIIRS